MELERENKRLKVLIVILLIFLVAFGGYYFYINVIKGNNKNTADDKEVINDIITSKDTEESKLPEWINYILEQDITTISIHRTRIAMNEGDSKIDETVDISKDDLEIIFKQFSNYNLIKEYSLGMGGAVGDNLTITYKVNDNISNYSINIQDGFIMSDTINDSNLIKLLEESNYTIENEDLKEQENSFYVFKFDSNYNNSIYDKYFK